jgi:hypothetical protein
MLESKLHQMAVSLGVKYVHVGIDLEKGIDADKRINIRIFSPERELSPNFFQAFTLDEAYKKAAKALGMTEPPEDWK